MSLIAWFAIVLTVGLLILLPTGAFTATLPLVAVATALATAIASLVARADPAPASTTPPARAPLAVPLLATALLLLTLLTLLPLPLSLSAIGGAQRHAQNQIVDEVIYSAEALELMSPVPHTYAITRNGAGTVRWTLLLIAMVSTAMLATRLGPTAREAYLRALTLMGAAIAVAGLISLRLNPQGDTLWWIFPVPAELPPPVACFRNRNHFAGFLAFLVPTALALLVRDLSRHRILATLTSLLTLACLSLGIVASLSRGGMLALAAGLGACLVLFACYRKWRVTILIGGLAALAAVAMLSAPWPALRERLATLTNLEAEHSYQTRLAAWRDCAHIVAAYPILGAGANGFRSVYPQHRSTSHGGIMKYAENAYVQWATDMGIVGILLGGCLLLAGVRTAWPTLRQPDRITIPVAALGGLAVVATHCLFDDPMRVPLYAITVASVLGLTLPPLRPSSHALPNRIRNAAPALVNLLAATVLILAWTPRLNDDISAHFPTMPIAKLARALAWAPTSQFAWVTLGERIAAAKTPESNLLARQCYSRALQYDPNNYRLLDHIGYLRLDLGDHAGAREAFTRVKELRWWKQVPEIPSDP